jgi:hypothetical protein
MPIPRSMRPSSSRNSARADGVHVLAPQSGKGRSNIDSLFVTRTITRTHWLCPLGRTTSKARFRTDRIFSLFGDDHRKMPKRTCYMKYDTASMR